MCRGGRGYKGGGVGVAIGVLVFYVFYVRFLVGGCWVWVVILVV